MGSTKAPELEARAYEVCTPSLVRFALDGRTKTDCVGACEGRIMGSQAHPLYEEKIDLLLS